MAEYLYNEKELLLRVAQDDQASFSKLLSQHWSAVYVFALMYLQVAHTAEELTQDVFVDIWKQRKSLPNVDSFSNYLFIITRNKTYSLLRKRLTRIVDENINYKEEKLYVPDTQLMYKELSEQLNQAIDRLPPKRKRVFIMSRMEGLSHAEIAEKLNISKQTVNEHIVEAMQFLKNFLRNHSALSLLLTCLAL